MADIHSTIQTMKASADREVGRLMGRLNLCGPRGNRSVESALDFHRGRSDALNDVLALLVPAEEANTG